MSTYQERIARYRIVRHSEESEERKAILRLHGIDPDDRWELIWSFPNKADAEKQLVRCKDYAAEWETYKLVDAGQEEVIERQAWF